MSRKSKKRNVLNSPSIRQIKKKKREIFWLKVFLYFLACCAVIIGFIFLFRWQKLNIQNVQVEVADTADSQAIKQLVEQDITGDYLFFLPKSNVWLFPTKAIEEEIAAKYKNLENISMEISQAGVLDVSAGIRKAAYLWCGDDFSYGPPGQCYFMDDTGYIFEEAPNFSGDVYFSFYGKFPSENSPLGASYLPGIFQKIIAFKKNLDEMGLKPFVLQAMDGEDMEFYLYSPNSGAAEPPAIIFSASAGDFTTLAENLQTALTTEPLKTEFQKKYASLQYIDLRYGNRVYYKFK